MTNLCYSVGRRDASLKARTRVCLAKVAAAAAAPAELRMRALDGTGMLCNGLSRHAVCGLGA